MSTAMKTAGVGGLLILVALMGLIDAVTGSVPDLTILYLAPIVAAAVLLGMPGAVVVACGASIADLLSNLERGVPFDVSLATGVASRLVIFLFAAVVVSSLVAQLRRITELEQRRRYDLDIAGEAHAAVFESSIDEYEGLMIGTKLTFSAELGGDYYHLARTNGRLFVCIGDIAGKSIAAALYTRLLHEAVVRALDLADEPSAVASLVNSQIHAAVPDDMFVTLFCASIDEDAISYVNAGHELPLLYSAASRDVRLLQSADAVPVGVQADLRIATDRVSFAPGDVLVGVTDGVTHAPAVGGDVEEKLGAVVVGNAVADAQRIADAVHSLAVPDTSRVLHDDVTVVCIKRPG